MLLVALNYRAFDVLWGANQVIYSNDRERQQLFQNLEQMRPVIDRAWADTLEVFRLLTGPLWEVITNPEPFRQIIDAIPAFRLKFDRYTGVYAARKLVGDITFIIAVNLEEKPILVSIPVPGTTATDLITKHNLFLKDGRISITLPACAARVYAVR